MIRLALAQALLGHTAAVTLRDERGHFVTTPDLKVEGRLWWTAIGLVALLGASVAAFA